MRTMLRTAMLMAGMLVGGARMMHAQEIDPSTGMNVSAASDSTDSMSIATGEPTNAAMEFSAQGAADMEATLAAEQSAQDAAYQSQQNAQVQQNYADFVNTAQGSNDASPVVVMPSTPKPKMSPDGGKFVGSVQVALTDTDPNAVLHFTTNGKKANATSPIYAGPITVSSKEKISVVAIDPKDRASGVVSKTFKPKG
jgi:hypothetical protein